ncbi:hypothetical protein ACI2L1_05455 [Streptomyces sp. NPDC019531]|uniref:hypothetical protein n=1 Tax=Streptomyces sp. NPDC019531 TaxID=3365062 RepID=UPI00384B55FA
MQGFHTLDKEQYFTIRRRDLQLSNTPKEEDTMKFKGNIIRGAAAVSCAFGLAIGVTGSAIAAPENYTVYDGFGRTLGYGQWNDDPYGSILGDSIRACDSYSDGMWMVAVLDIDRDGYRESSDRIASTRGLVAGQCSSWKSGDLPENTSYTLWVSNEESGWTGNNITVTVHT